MKPELKTIAPRYWTRSSKAYYTMSTATNNTLPLKKVNMPCLQLQRRRNTLSLFQNNMVGFKSSLGWTEGNEPIIQWKGIVLNQRPTMPFLYLVNYDGIDCVYGLELYIDNWNLNLKVFPQKVVPPQVKNTHLASSMVRRSVEHQFEGNHGSKENWRGVGLSQVPMNADLFYITYEKDLELFTYKLLDDYAEGNLHIIPEDPQADLKFFRDNDDFTGQSLQFTRGDGSTKIGNVICKVPSKPSTYFIMFDDDTLIYVYNLVENTH